MGRPKAPRPGMPAWLPQHLRHLAVNHRPTASLAQPPCRADLFGNPPRWPERHSQKRDKNYKTVRRSTMRIDLNADVGESFGVYTLGQDAALMPHITSANVACGFHAGDPGVMRATVALAREHGVAVGAHPGFPDLAGFGRRELNATSREVEDYVVYQVGALAAMAGAQGVPLQHVKPHGALFNMAAVEAALADAIARAVAAVDPALILFALPESELQRAGERAGLRVAVEGFADRAYERDGRLVPRSNRGAVITDPAVVMNRALMMAREGVVTACDGSVVRLHIDTICIHGDTRGAGELAVGMRRALENAGIEIAAVSRPSRPSAESQPPR